jgi:AraC-like DNA-binding protein
MNVRQVVSSSLTQRHPNVQLVARTLGMSARTLQRRLGDLGLTYVGVVAQARTELARQMLEDPRAKIGDIARTLGYSEAGHFTRAFLRWTGVGPREFRRLMRAAAETPAGERRGPLPYDRPVARRTRSASRAS